MAASAPQRFPFAFAPSYRLPARLLGVTEATAFVLLGEDAFEARFGRWHVTTARANIAAVYITGPYRYLKTAGPAHLTFGDHGLTFATTGARGVCLDFVEPIRGIEPTGRLRHPNLTVTVADCAGLAAALGVSDGSTARDD
ncbi:MAG: hypothetical protein JWN61_654 [Pseudonocardiales bacterium]|nr:hypothetical protein [Pseudonocardiales bacterium]